MIEAMALPLSERVSLAQALWESITREEAQLPVPDWKRDELRRRKQRFQEDPASGRTWEQVKKRAQAQHD